MFTDTTLWLLWKRKILSVRDCDRVSFALTSLSTFNFGHPNLCFKILSSFSAIKQPSQMALSGVTCPSCCLQDLGRRQGEECNHTSAIGSGIPGFDSSSVESCQPDSCQVVSVWVFPAVSVGIVSQQLRGMQSPALEMTLCWDLRLFAVLFLPQVLYSELPHCTPELYLLSCLPSLSLHLPSSASSGSIKPALDNSSLCLLLGSGLLKGFARAPHDMCTALVNEEFCIGT